MAKSNKKQRHRKPPAPRSVPSPWAEEVPPGATPEAHYRPINRTRGGPGSAAGPRHAANDSDSTAESYEATDSNVPLADIRPGEPGPMEEGPPYAGQSGGAVGGAPAEGRASGGRTHHGIDPGSVHRGDSTVGAEPENKNRSSGKRKTRRS